MHKLQIDIDEEIKPSIYYKESTNTTKEGDRRPEDEYEADMELYDEEKSYTLREGY